VISAAVASIALATGIAAGPFEIERFAPERGRPEIVVAPRPGRRATLVVAFGAGSVDDGGRSGLVRLAQHALLSANRRIDFPRLAVEIFAGAGALRIETGLRDCSFIFTADRRDFDRLAPRLIEALLEPRLDPDRFEMAVRRATHDGQEPGRGQSLVTVVASLATEDPRYWNDPHGDPDQMESFTTAEVEPLLAGPLSPANAIVAAAGSFDRDALLLSVRLHSGGRRQEPGRPPLRLPVQSRRRSAKEVHLIAYPIRPETARAAAAAHVLAPLVEEELWREFRETGVAYSFAATPVPSRWLDLFVVALPAHDSSSASLGAPLNQVLERVAKGSYPDQSFRLARATALARIKRVDRDSEALAAALAAARPPWHGRATAEAVAVLGREALGEEIAAWLSATNSIRLDAGPTEAP